MTARKPPSVPSVPSPRSCHRGRPGDGRAGVDVSRGCGRLAASPLVRVVTPNAPIKTQALALPPGALALRTTFDQSVGATDLWRQTTGQGVGVAVIDTGIAGDLSDFRTSRLNAISRVGASAVIDPGAGTANDTYGHGTLVAGLIGGNGDNRPLLGSSWGQYVGTAPNANLISVKIADDSGQSTILDAIYGLQFAVDHKDQYNIRVVNLSFRSTTPGSYTTDPLDAAAEQAWMHGIVVVVAAAGNLGTASDAVSYAPGNDPYVLTVGAVDEQGTPQTADDVTASWSSQESGMEVPARPSGSDSLSNGSSRSLHPS